MRLIRKLKIDLDVNLVLIDARDEILLEEILQLQAITFDLLWRIEDVLVQLSGNKLN